MTEIGDAGAAQLNQAGKGGAVRRAADNDIQPVAGLLQWGTVVGCAKEYDVLQLVRPAQIILAGIVNSTSGKQVLELLERMNDDGLTLIVVTHDPAVGRRADRVLRMFDGKIVERTAGQDLPRVLGVVAEDAEAGSETELETGPETGPETGEAD